MTRDLRVWTLGTLMVLASACGVDKVTAADGGSGGSASGGSVGSGGVGGTAGGGGAAGAAGGRGGSPASGGRGGTTAATGGVSGQGGQGGQGGRGGQGGLACSFSSTVTITESGGLVGVVRTTTLTPPASYRVQGRQTQGAPSCMPALPGCGGKSFIDVSDLEQALTHADVQTALSTNARYGNLQVADGSAWRVARSSGGAFDLSNFEIACTPSATCIPTPDGVKALIQVIRNLNTQQLADPSCAGVGN